ncbi:MAG: hypothetical protein ABI454_06100 [Sphingomicrobium sp.]
MARTNQRGRNNNPEGRNQYSNGWMDTARERPFAAAATAAAAVGAGVFLWSRRNQISDQISGLSEQLGEWTSNMQSGSSDGAFEMAGTSSRSRGQTGGGNATPGAQSEGGETTASASGRGRTQRAPTA